MKKIFYVVLDGLGDMPIEELGGKTPLQAAHTPFMDSLAKSGAQGIIYPVEKGVAPESDIAVISLLGYDAHKLYTGRGPLESFAEGIEVADGDLALRVNFATLKSGSTDILDRRVGRDLSTQEATQLTAEINEKVKLKGASFIFKNTIGHRGILVIRKEGNLSGWITNTDPAYDREGVFGIAKEKFEFQLLKANPMPGYEDDPKARSAADLLNEFTENSHKVLSESQVNKARQEKGKMPGNVILSRDAGDKLPKFDSISKTTGIDFGCFVQMPVEKGIALLCDMSVVEVPLPSGDVSKDYPLWAEKAKENIAKYGGLYIHIKGPDEPAHDGDFMAKKANIEAIDKFFFANLLQGIDQDDFVFCVTADHSTVCKLKAHTADPVPVIIKAKSLEADATSSFSEFQAKDGSLGAFLGRELIYKLVDFAKK